MNKPTDTQIDDILRSESAAGWQGRLTAAFFDSDARRQAVDEIHHQIAALIPDIGPGELEGLQQRLIRCLLGMASRDARPPARETGPPPAMSDGAELEDRVIRTYPHPIAIPYRALTEQESAAASFGCLLDTFESLIHFLASVVVSAYLRGGLAHPECNRLLLMRLVKDAWSSGDLLALLRDTVRLAEDCEGRLPYRELPGYLFDARGKPTASLRVLESFVGLRNRVWGHGTGRDEAFYAGILGPNRTRLEQELARVGWLAGWELVRPVAIDEAGRVTRADLLTGDRRLKDRPFVLELAPEDLDSNGGDVRAEKSLLLVAPDRGAYLPLFPLSLFHFQLRAQGVYFLQRPQWQPIAAGRRLRKASYVSYASDLGDHEEGPGEPAVRSLEQHIARLESRLTGAGVSIDTNGAGATEAAADPDCELPEVRHEQQFHLRTFAGREELLRRIDLWIDGASEGGYLLILGPPGQGKSALVAELARHRGEQGGCLLHMVKSHRNPLRFLPSLITQAARLAGARFGEGSYRGDLDDLRNALLRALEAVASRAGRAVVVIDALDELDIAGEHLAFLPESFPAGVRVVLTCRPDIPLVQALHARLSGLEQWDLPPLSEDDLPLVMERRLGSEGVQALAGGMDWSRLFQRLQGNPLFLQARLDQIARVAAEARQEGRPLRLDPEAFPATLEALFRDIYNEVAEKQGTRYTSPEGRQKARLLHLLCLAREPLGFEPLGELMAMDGSPLSLEDCRDRVLEMSQYMLDIGGDRFQPWHQGLVDYVRVRVLGESGCRSIEEAFCTWLQRPASRQSLYGLRHRVRHLLAVPRFEELEAALTDFTLLEARAEAGMVFELAADFAAALHVLPADRPAHRLLGLLEQAIRIDLHFIARHPTTLFQCLWNRGWWFDAPEAASHRTPPPGGWPVGTAPWEQPEPRLSTLLQDWRTAKEAATPGFLWVRSLRPPLDDLGTTQRAVFRGHRSAVSCVAYAPDGRRIASGSYDATIRLWDTEGGAELACLRAPGAVIESLSFSPDGRHLVAGSEDRIVSVWDVESGTELIRLSGHDGAVKGVAFAPDGTWIASGSTDHTVRVWDAHRFSELLRLRGPLAGILGVAFAPEGRRVACGSEDGTARVWDADTGAELARMEGHTDAVTSVAFTWDGAHLVTGSRDRTVRVWDATTGVERTRLCGHDYSVTSVGVAPDGRRVVSASADLTIRLWDLDSGAELASLHGHRYSILGVAFSPNGRHIVSASGDGTVRIWDAVHEAAWGRLHGHEGWVTLVAVSPDGRQVRSASGDGTVLRWDVSNGDCIGVAGESQVFPIVADEAPLSRWHAYARYGETVFVEKARSVEAAWLPAGMTHLVSLVDGRTWAGATYNYVYLLVMEGNGMPPA